MAVFSLSLGVGQLVSATQKLPFSYESWQGGGVSFLVVFPTGTTVAPAGINVQMSNDANAGSSQASIAATARWNLHDILQGLTASKNDNLGFPCAFVRLAGTVLTGTVWLDIGMADSSPPVA